MWRPRHWAHRTLASPSSGAFRDVADFAVLVLFQKDDPFGHPLFSDLPDGGLTGLVLDFDVTWQGNQSWESLKNAWTDRTLSTTPSTGSAPTARSGLERSL